MEQQKFVQFGSKKIVFSLSYRKRKSLGIKVHPDCKVEVIAPSGSDESLVLKKVKTKAPWILNQQAYFHSFLPLPSPKRFVNGETHRYMGRQYRLRVIKSKANKIKISAGFICIYANKLSKKSLNDQLAAWYKESAHGLFPEILESTMELFKKYKIGTPKLTIKKMSKRWGSCTPSGKIILNTDLIKAPKACIEYVVIHELCHLVHYNHGKKFQALLDKMMPDWKKWKDKLERIS